MHPDGAARAEAAARAVANFGGFFRVEHKKCSVQRISH
jgi:hypothetical protein